MKIYFFPGLGADSSLANFHKIQGYETKWIEWPKEFGSTWNEFINKILSQNSIEPNGIYVGISFGGLVAQHLANIISPKKIILVGSLKTKKDISVLLLLFLPAIKFVPSLFFKIDFLPEFLIKYFFGIQRTEDVILFKQMAGRISNDNSKKLIMLVVENRQIFGLSDRTISIHGDRDKILPIGKQFIDYKIKNGGHLISMTHQGQVNESILECIQK